MSAKDAPEAEKGLADNVNHDGAHNEDSLANKLSKELSNWRKQRHGSRPRRPESSAGPNVPPEPARTIRVRGHETLVVRKSKLAPKPPADRPSDSN